MVIHNTDNICVKDRLSTLSVLGLKACMDQMDRETRYNP